MSTIVIRRESLTARTAPPGDGFVAMAVRRKLPLRAVGRLAYRAGRRASREDVEDSDSPGSPFCAKRAPGDGFVAMAVRRKLPLRAVGRLAYRAGRRASREDVEDSDSPGNPLCTNRAPGGRLRGNSSSPEAPLRAVGRLAYHAGRCASGEDVKDSDSPGTPLRNRGLGDGFEAMAARRKPPARRRSFGISRRMMRIGGRCKDSDSPGNPSARTHPGEGFMAMAAHRKPPLRAVGRLAYRAGWRSRGKGGCRGGVLSERRRQAHAFRAMKAVHTARREQSGVHPAPGQTPRAGRLAAPVPSLTPPRRDVFPGTPAGSAPGR